MATTTPPGLPEVITFNGSPDAPTNVGNCAVIGTIKDLNYQASATNTLVILPAPTPITVIGAAMQPGGSFPLTFSNTPGVNFSVLATANVASYLSNWTVLGFATETPAGLGQFQFTDSQATNDPQRFYRIRSP